MKLIPIAPGQVKAIPINQLIPDPGQPRKTFDQAKLKELAQSLKDIGQETPIKIRKNGEKNYIIKHGERRLRAAQIAKLKTLDCILAMENKGEDAEFKTLVQQFADNADREDLNAIDLAHFFKTLRDDYEMKATEIPAMLDQYGIKKDFSDSYIRNLIRLTELPPWAQQYIQTGQLTAKHGLQLLPVIGLADIMKNIKPVIDNELKAGEGLTAGDLADHIYDQLDETFPTARQVHISEHTDLNNPGLPLYNVEKLPKADQDKLGLVTVPNRWGNGSTQFITNTGKHGELQKQAREKILAERKKAEEKSKQKASGKKSKGGEQSQEKNIEPRAQGLHDYLLAWLGKAIMDALNGIDSSEPVFDRLLYWLGFGKPEAPRDDDTFSYHGPSNDWQQRKINDVYVKTAGHFSLRDFLTNKLDDAAIINQLMQRAIACCDLEHRSLLAKHLGIEIERLFRVDDDYLKLYTKDGLLHLAAGAKLDKEPGWTAIKNAKTTVSGFRTYLVGQKESIGCPTHILDLIKESLDGYHEGLKEAMQDREDYLKKQEKKKNGGKP